MTGLDEANICIGTRTRPGEPQRGNPVFEKKRFQMDVQKRANSTPLTLRDHGSEKRRVECVSTMRRYRHRAAKSAMTAARKQVSEAPTFVE